MIFLFSTICNFVTIFLCFHFPLHLTSVTLISKVSHYLRDNDITETIIPNLKDRLQCYFATTSNQIISLGKGKKLMLTFSWSIAYPVVVSTEGGYTQGPLSNKICFTYLWPFKNQTPVIVHLLSSKIEGSSI